MKIRPALLQSEDHFRGRKQSATSRLICDGARPFHSQLPGAASGRKWRIRAQHSNQLRSLPLRAARTALRTRSGTHTATHGATAGGQNYTAAGYRFTVRRQSRVRRRRRTGRRSPRILGAPLVRGEAQVQRGRQFCCWMRCIICRIGPQRTLGSGAPSSHSRPRRSHWFISTACRDRIAGKPRWALLSGLV
jgi:hypothetical protein